LNATQDIIPHIARQHVLQTCGRRARHLLVDRVSIVHVGRHMVSAQVVTQWLETLASKTRWYYYSGRCLHVSVCDCIVNQKPEMALYVSSNRVTRPQVTDLFVIETFLQSFRLSNGLVAVESWDGRAVASNGPPLRNSCSVWPVDCHLC